MEGISSNEEALKAIQQMQSIIAQQAAQLKALEEMEKTISQADAAEKEAEAALAPANTFAATDTPPVISGDDAAKLQQMRALLASPNSIPAGSPPPEVPLPGAPLAALPPVPAAPVAPAPAPAAAPPPDSSLLIPGKVFPGCMYGIVKSFDPQAGRGFVTCPQCTMLFNEDVVLTKEVMELSGAKIDNKVRFFVEINQESHPQVRQMDVIIEEGAPSAPGAPAAPAVAAPGVGISLPKADGAAPGMTPPSMGGMDGATAPQGIVMPNGGQGMMMMPEGQQGMMMPNGGQGMMMMPDGQQGMGMMPGMMMPNGAPGMMMTPDQGMNPGMMMPGMMMPDGSPGMMMPQGMMMNPPGMAMGGNMGGMPGMGMPDMAPPAAGGGGPDQVDFGDQYWLQLQYEALGQLGNVAATTAPKPKGPVVQGGDIRDLGDFPNHDPTIRYQGSVTVWKDYEGFGWMKCREATKVYGKDVFLHRAQIGNETDVHKQRTIKISVGDEVTFNVEIRRGLPSAIEAKIIQPLGKSKAPREFAVRPSFVEAPAGEGWSSDDEPVKRKQRKWRGRSRSR